MALSDLRQPQTESGLVRGTYSYVQLSGLVMNASFNVVYCILYRTPVVLERSLFDACVSCPWLIGPLVDVKSLVCTIVEWTI